MTKAPPSRHFFRVGRFVPALLSLFLLVAGITLALQPRYSTPTALGTVPPTVTASPLTLSLPSLPPLVTSPNVSAATPSRPAAPRESPAQTLEPPVHISVPAQGISAPVVAVGVSAAGALEVPEDIHTVGWWRFGAAPGAARGTVVFAGHVDSAVQGKGALFRLERLQPGDSVTVATAQGSHSYVVEARRSYEKKALPASVFDQSGNARLVLITCGGPFNRTTRSYAFNVVVYAVPA